MSMTPQQWRELIECEIAELDQGEQERKGAEATVSLDQQMVGRLSRMDALQMQAMARAEGVRAKQRRQQLIGALKRLDNDDFGWCQACGEPIPEPRLKVNPVALYCMDCAR